MKLIVRELTASDEQSFFDGFKEWVGESPHWYTFAWKEGMIYPEMLEILRKDALGIDLPEGRVPHTMLYGFWGSQIVGRVSIRHTLNENLRRRGGHIGYAVAPRFRRQGYASDMLLKAMEFCREKLGLTSVMLSCADENIPSWKMLEKFGGKLEDITWDDIDHEQIRRYWIDLSK